MTAFDALAVDYDTTFTDTGLGRLLRLRVWHTLDAIITPGDRVLELNCGTGEDAVHMAGLGAHVTATDVSAAMVQAAAAKAAAAGFDDRVDLRHLAIEHLATLHDAPFDHVVSNFGGLNCVADLGAVARDLERLVRPGGSAVLVLMGPVVPWEWLWFLARGRPGSGFRRLRGQTTWRGITVRYPTPAATKRCFAAGFSVVACSPIGVVLPPTYVEPWLGRHPRVLGMLDRADRAAMRVRASVLFGDHYLVHLQRR